MKDYGNKVRLMAGWIGVDLDGTLATYDGCKGEAYIGDPVYPMLGRVKVWLAMGCDVRIFTARVYPGGPSEKRDISGVTTAIQNWCREYIGQVLPITCTKDYGMVELWDDRAIQIIPNTGLRADGQP